MSAGPARGLKLPQLGFGLANNALTAREAERLRLLRPAHLRADLYPEKLDATLDRAAAALKLLPGCALEAAVFVSAGNEATELAAVAEGVASRGIGVVRWMVFHRDESSTNQRWIELARKQLPKGVPIGGGSNLYFAELNRGRPEHPDAFDFLAYPVNSQVHAFDDRSLLENTAGQGDTVRTARFFGKEKPVVVSPLTLKSKAVDPRQNSLQAVVWTLASLKQLTESKAASATYFETHGAGGLLSGDAVYPVFHVFASIAGHGAADQVLSDQPGEVEALLLRSAAGATRLVVANLTNEVRVVDCRSLVKAGSVQMLDQQGLQLVGQQAGEVALMPYGLAVLTA